MQHNANNFNTVKEFLINIKQTHHTSSLLTFLDSKANLYDMAKLLAAKVKDSNRDTPQAASCQSEAFTLSFSAILEPTVDEYPDQDKG